MCIPYTDKNPQDQDSDDQSNSHSGFTQYLQLQVGLLVNRTQTSSQGALGVDKWLHLYMGHSPGVGIDWSATDWSEGDGDPVSE